MAWWNNWQDAQVDQGAATLNNRIAPGKDSAKNMAKQLSPSALGRMWDPTQGYSTWNQIVGGDQPYQSAAQSAQRALGDATKYGSRLSGATRSYARYANRFLGQDIGALRGQAYGEGPSYAEKYGAAQRQQAQGDIAKQAMMSSRGSPTAATQRAAVMQSADVGANMAAQIAAARVQEQQQAMQTYLAAQQARLQARQSGLTARQADAQFRGQLAQLRQQQQMNELNRIGGTANLAQTTYSQFGNAMQGSKMFPWQD